MSIRLAVLLILLAIFASCLISSRCDNSVARSKNQAAAFHREAMDYWQDGTDGYSAKAGDPIPMSLLKASYAFQTALLLDPSNVEIKGDYLICLSELAMYVGRGPNNVPAATYLAIIEMGGPETGGTTNESERELCRARAYWLLDRTAEYNAILDSLRRRGLQKEVDEARPSLENRGKN